MTEQTLTITISELQERIAQHLTDIGAYQSVIKTNEHGQFVAEELYCCAYHYYECGKYSEGIDFFNLLTQMDPESTANWIGLGACHHMLKNYNEALLAYSTALVLDQNNPTVYLHAANCCFALKHLAEGFEALDVVESIAQKNPEHERLLIEVDLLREVWSNPDKVCSENK
jgi:type III secretion system low calcium response chaperone LcrH/SycD